MNSLGAAVGGSEKPHPDGGRDRSDNASITNSGVKPSTTETRKKPSYHDLRPANMPPLPLPPLEPPPPMPSRAPPIPAGARPTLGLQARGPTEHDDNAELRYFFSASHREREGKLEENRPEEYGSDVNAPGSRFSWDSGDIRSSRPTEALRSIQRLTKRAQVTQSAINNGRKSSSSSGGVPDVSEPDSADGSSKTESAEKEDNDDSASSIFKLNSFRELFSKPIWKTDSRDPMSFMRNRSSTEGSQHPPGRGVATSGIRASSESVVSLTSTYRPGKSTHSPDEPSPLHLFPSTGGSEESRNLVWGGKRGGLLEQEVVEPSGGGLETSAGRLQSTPYTPKRREKHNAGLRTLSSLARFDAAGNRLEDGEEPISPAEPLSVRLANSPNLKNAKGYPKGPHDPQWDECVKHVKKSVKAQEKKEAEEAKQLKKEQNALEKEKAAKEKKLRRLHAGKQAIGRGSQLGLITTKSLDDITEEEFETLGAFAIAPTDIPATPTSERTKKLGSVFTKVLGSKKATEDHVKQTLDKLERHQSLDLLKSEYAAEVLRRLDQGSDSSQYDNVLRLLSSGNTPSQDITTSQRKIAARTGELVYNRRPESNRTVFRDSIGLGIFDDCRDVLTESLTTGTATGWTNFDQPPPRSSLRSLRPWWLGLNNPSDSSASANDSVDDPSSFETDPESPLSRPSRLPASRSRLDAGEEVGVWQTEPVLTSDALQKAGTATSVPTAYPSNLPDVRPSPAYYVDARFNVAYNTTDRSSHVGQLENAEDEDYISDYSDDEESPDPDAVPRPLNIRVLRVKKSRTQLQPSDSNSFVPDRHASFHAKLTAVSELQRAHIGTLSHPAFREETHDEARPSSEETAVDKDGSFLDFEIGSPASTLRGFSEEMVADEDHTTDVSRQVHFEDRPTSAVRGRGYFEMQQDQQEESPDNESLIGRAIDGDINLTTLRRQVGLGPLRVACATNSPAHPHHSFTWDHEKIMCRQVHNPTAKHAESRQTETHQTGVNPLSPSPYGTKDGQKSCHNCGARCCRFANLIVTSKIKTGGDSAGENVRATAELRVNQLRSQHPNGVEDYETFLTCDHCRHFVCPGCAQQCSRKGCQTIVCGECGGEDRVCPVHNSF